ncbi:aspartate kinase [Bacteroidota bacterium]
MARIVVKFGGSNLKTVKDIQRLVKIVKSYNRPIVIVVSAFYGVTDKLNELLENINSINNSSKPYTSFLIKIKKNFIEKNFEDEKIGAMVFDEIKIRLEELEKLYTGLNFLGEVFPSVEDHILSYGEKLSSLILARMLQSKGIECEEVFPEDIPIITDGEYGNATVNLQASEKAVKKRLVNNKIYIVPGFYGVSKKGKITLLGRGGTDYAAAAIANCINAESLDIWKDVDGFQSADPKLVTAAKRLETISYNEAAELAYFGARILHPRTVEPLTDKKIPIRIMNINDITNLSKAKTIITSADNIMTGVIKSVTSNEDFCILRLYGPGVGMKPGILAKVTTRFDLAGVNIKSVLTSQIAINFLLSKKDLRKAYNITKNLDLVTVRELETIDDISVIAMVGQGILEKPGLAAKIFGAVGREGINVEMISVGASRVGSYFMVKSSERINAIKALHKEFFEN